MSQKSGRKAIPADSSAPASSSPAPSAPKSAAPSAPKRAAPSAPSGGTSSSQDTVLIRGISEDGQALSVLRARDDRIEVGVVRPLREGEAIMGELVRLKPRPEFPLVCDVEVELPSRIPAGAQQAKLSHGGPAQVATESYRENWDAIWKKPAGPQQPN